MVIMSVTVGLHSRRWAQLDPGGLRVEGGNATKTMTADSWVYVVHVHVVIYVKMSQTRAKHPPCCGLPFLWFTIPPPYALYTATCEKLPKITYRTGTGTCSCHPAATTTTMRWCDHVCCPTAQRAVSMPPRPNREPRAGLSAVPWRAARGRAAPSSRSP